MRLQEEEDLQKVLAFNSSPQKDKGNTAMILNPSWMDWRNQHCRGGSRGPAQRAYDL